MASNWGRILQISLFGESHGSMIGVVIDGLPAGEKVDLQELQVFMARRAPGRTPWSSARKEADSVSILSGLYREQTTGTPLCLMIENRGHRPADYAQRVKVPRPSHADYTGVVRYRGASDPRGGGHFSGRLTAPLCAAGAICRQILRCRGIEIYARIAEFGGICDLELDIAEPDIDGLRGLASKRLPVCDQDIEEKMISFVSKVNTEGDSLGGVIQCFAIGLPAGLGDPIFGGVESHLAPLIYGIPAVKGLSFGAGFAACRRRGSQNNDQLYLDQDSRVRTLSNNEGGINGGITNGMPLVLQVGIKPTPSIALPQQSINLDTMCSETLEIRGRHDPAIVPRVVPVIEAVVAIGLLDLMLISRGSQGFGGDFNA